MSESTGVEDWRRDLESRLTEAGSDGERVTVIRDSIISGRGLVDAGKATRTNLIDMLELYARKHRLTSLQLGQGLFAKVPTAA